MFTRICHTILSKQRAFTLAEMLIALAILGVISTLTIPAMLTTNQTNKYNAIVRESATAVAAAYQTYLVQGNIAGSSTYYTNLVPYLNYVKQDTSSVIDVYPNNPYISTIDCSQTTYNSCYKLHNGAVISFDAGIGFGGNGSTNAICFFIDPDGALGNAKGVGFALYVNGQVLTYGTMKPNTQEVEGGGGPYTLNPNTSYDPTWLKWN